MTDVTDSAEPTEPTEPSQSTAASVSADEAARASRRWRTLWRTHFYSGVFAAPILLMFAITGLVILYTQPLNDALQGDLRTVNVEGAPASLDEQREAALAKYPGAVITSVVTPADKEHSTEFGTEDSNSIFVNPYTTEVLGRADPGGGIVGLSNRLHGVLNNDSVTVKLPAIGGLLGEDPIMQEFVVGDLVLEIFGCWAIVLVVSGIYLWWPRRTRAAAGASSTSGTGATGARKALFVPRLGKKGRARWRDLHAIPGVLAAVVTLFVLTTGMFWSSYWGINFSQIANRITPNNWVDPPNSSIAKLGDIDRLKNRINWNTGDAAIPNSMPEGVDPEEMPAPMSLDSIARVANQEGMLAGYSIEFPINGTDDAGNPAFGSYALVNSWPRKTSEAKTVYLDQFSGSTISTMDVYGYGGVSVVADTLVSVHMGTQLGIVSRVVLTIACVAVIWSVISSFVMYSKRRRKATLGLPRRPRDLRLANGLIALMVLIGLVYPLWGVTAAMVLLADRFVIRKVPKLRMAFGQR